MRSPKLVIKANAKLATYTLRESGRDRRGLAGLKRTIGGEVGFYMASAQPLKYLGTS